MWRMVCVLLAAGPRRDRPGGATGLDHPRADGVGRRPVLRRGLRLLDAGPAGRGVAGCPRHRGDAGGPLLFLPHEGSDYRLRRIRSPQMVPPARVAAELAHLRQGDLKGDARLVKETPIVVDGVIGHDFTYTVPSPGGPGVVTKRTRHFIRDRSYYVLTVASPPGQPLADDAARFLSSLTFDAAVKAYYARMKAESRTAGPARDEGPRVEDAGESGRFHARGRPQDVLPGAAGPGRRGAASRHAARRRVPLAVARTPRVPGRPRADENATGADADEATQSRRCGQAGGWRIPDPETRRPARGRAMVWPAARTRATRLEDVRGHWKVDARPLIAARRAAAEARSARPRPPSP